MPKNYTELSGFPFNTPPPASSVNFAKKGVPQKAQAATLTQDNKKEKTKKKRKPSYCCEREPLLRQPRIERGTHRWQRWILPLNH